MTMIRAGQPIQQTDFPAAVYAFVEANETDITATTFVAGANPCNTTFVAGVTGNAMIVVTGVMRSSASATPADHIRLSFELYEGTDETGTLIVSATYSRSAISIEEPQVHGASTVHLATGLTPGATHFVRTMHRTATGDGTCDIVERAIMAWPVG